MPHPAVRAFHPAVMRSGAVAALLVVAACPAPRASAPARPAPARPTSPGPATPTVSPTRFAYTSAPTTFDVATEGTVTTEGDSAAPLHVATTTRVTLAIADASGDDARPVHGTVDAFATPGGRAAPTSIRLPLAFAGILDTRRHRATLSLVTPQPADTACLAPLPAAAPTGAPPIRPAPATPALSLLATTRDLLVTAPAQLDVGTRWDEESESVECRGLVAVTTRTRYRYEVRGPATFGGVATAVRVARTSESESQGRQETGGRTVRVEGKARGAFDLYLDPVAGRYLGGTGQSEGTLQVDVGDGHPRRFMQRFTTRIGARTRPATR